MTNLQIGDKVRDTVSGFDGTVTSLTTYITGSDRATVTGHTLDSDGHVREEWFDIERLEVVES